MNSKTTLFFVYILLAQMLFFSPIFCSKAKITISLRKDNKISLPLLIETKSKIQNNDITNKVKENTLYTNTNTNKKEDINPLLLQTKSKVIVNQNPTNQPNSKNTAIFTLKNADTLNNYSNLKDLVMKLINMDKKEFLGEYNGSQVIFKNLPVDIYRLTLNSFLTVNFEDMFDYRTNELDSRDIYLINKTENKNLWRAVLTWKNSNFELLSAEVSENQIWYKDLTEKEYLLRKMNGPQITSFEVTEKEANKRFASYEVYNSKGFNSLSRIGGKVSVYHGNYFVNTYNQPLTPFKLEGSDKGRIWHIFQVVAGHKIEYHEYNEITSISTNPGWYLNKIK